MRGISPLAGLIEGVALDYFSGLALPRRHYPRQVKTCLLARCSIEHQHNNAFCSPEHCREWRAAHPYNGKGRP